MHRIVVAFLAALMMGSAFAQPYPAKPIRIMVGQGAGSVGDVRARWVAQRLAPLLGQPVIVENKLGAGGNVAAEYVAKSAPDGYTLLLAHMGTLVGPDVYPNVGFDPLSDFTPISRISKGYGVLTVNPQVPARTVQDLVQLARAQPGKLNYGSTGIGAPPWMMAELFRRQANIDVTHVPYKGGGELLQDLIGGRIDFWIEGPLIQMQHIQSGRLRALAVTGPHRLAFLPDVPTLKEAGLPDYEFQGWTGLVAPAGTPRAVVEKLNAGMHKVLLSAEATDWLQSQANEAAVESPEAFAEYLKQQRAQWAPIVRHLAVKGQM